MEKECETPKSRDLKLYKAGPLLESPLPCRAPSGPKDLISQVFLFLATNDNVKKQGLHLFDNTQAEFSTKFSA